MVVLVCTGVPPVPAPGYTLTVTVRVYAGASASGTPLQTLTATVAAGGAYSVEASPAIAQGQYTAQARQSDAAGNTGLSTANTFVVDTDAPSVTLTSPLNGS